MPLNFTTEVLIPLQNDPITYSFVNEIRRTNFSPGPIRLRRVPFSTNPILLHRVPFSSMTFSSCPILLHRVPFSYSDKMTSQRTPLLTRQPKRTLVQVHYDSIVYLLVLVQHYSTVYLLQQGLWISHILEQDSAHIQQNLDKNYKRP